jgi:hypothetical protein
MKKHTHGGVYRAMNGTVVSARRPVRAHTPIGGPNNSACDICTSMSATPRLDDSRHRRR